MSEIGKDQLMMYDLEAKYKKYGVKVSIRRLGNVIIYIPLIVKDKDENIIFKSSDLKNEIHNKYIVYLTDLHASFRVVDPYTVIDNEGWNNGTSKR